jgi:hypothetical protein
VHFECLHSRLCLVELGVPWGEQFALHLLFMDALFERLQGYVVQCVFLQSEACQSHSVDYLLICLNHFFLRPALHRFDKDIVYLKADGHHDISVALLGSEEEGSHLVNVD